jgi:alanine transaminase
MPCRLAARVLQRPLAAAHLGRRSLSLSVETINPAVVGAQYAVRGELVLRAAEIKKQIKASPGSLPIKKVLECNIGNPQAVGQQPLSFGRQVQSLLAWPALMDMPGASEMFAPDAIARARAYLDAETRVGAYTESQGLSIVRQEVADFITARDGVPAVKENVFLTDGASKGVEFLLKLVLRGKDDGVLVPIPQYPLYSAALALAQASTCCPRPRPRPRARVQAHCPQAHLLPYELDEDAGWSLPIAQLEASLADARKNGVACRGLVVINPGNPTGNCLPLGNMQDIVRFCKKEGLVLMADEVYQENIYQGTAPFHSFKKVVAHLGEAAGAKRPAPLLRHRPV